MLDLIAAAFVRGLNIFFHVMPMRFNLWLGRQFGTLVYLMSGRRSNIAYANLKAAFRGEKSPGELKRVTKNSYKNMAQVFVEIMSMTKVDKAYTDKYVRINNLERIETASKHPGGMILISAHFGNWELSTATSAIKGFPIYMLTRDQKMRRLNELLNTLRELKGNQVIRKGTDVKNIFRVLKEGKSVGMLADQNAGSGGELIEFFARPASTAVGPYRIAQKCGSVILPAFIHRVKGPYQELQLEELMFPQKGEDIKPFMLEYNKLLEKHIRAYPDQWLWMHKRWKLTTSKTIMILDDGKKGHLNQSLAVLEQIKRYRKDGGYKSGDIRAEIVPVRFKNGAAKVLFNAMSCFFSSGCQGCLKCLKAALTPDSYNEAVSRYADVIISCGSSLFGVNKMLKMENNARNVSVLDPGRLNRRAFNLVIMPRHDGRGGGAEAENAAVTDLAPNLITPERLKEVRDNNRDLTAGKKCIGVLFGGDNACFAFTEAFAGRIMDAIKKACAEMNGKYFVTTSRRTPGDVDAFMERSSVKDPMCLKFVSGIKDKDPGTVENLLAVSDVIAVSGESISMVSEAVSSGKPVLVFMPDKKTGRETKYEKFAASLSGRGFVRIVRPSDMAGEIRDAITRKTIFALPEDNEKIYGKLYKLF
ncbi:MAG: ELM1/GtrOC1 family putative glycosyltransferase [Candidatus Omnitrophota bacterium]